MNEQNEPAIPRGVPMSELRELALMLPQPYAEIDDEFLATNGEVIDEMKNLLKPFGDLHMVGVDNMMILCRIPSREIMQAFAKKSSSVKDALESDLNLIRPCMLYPSEVEVREWARIYPGISTVIGNGIISLAKVGVDPVIKKL